MNVDHNGSHYRIDFQHEIFDKPVVIETQWKGRKHIAAMTTCAVWKRPIGAPIADEVVEVAGRSMCSVEDRFVKDVARERALKRAIADLHPEQERELRGKLLSAYYTRPRHGKTKA